jgi:hypothetical protein
VWLWVIVRVVAVAGFRHCRFKCGMEVCSGEFVEESLGLRHAIVEWRKLESTFCFTHVVGQRRVFAVDISREG